MNIRRKARAKIDLWNIAEHISNDNPAAARKVLKAAEDLFEVLPVFSWAIHFGPTFPAPLPLGEGLGVGL